MDVKRLAARPLFVVFASFFAVFVLCSAASLKLKLAIAAVSALLAVCTVFFGKAEHAELRKVLALALVPVCLSSLFSAYSFDRRAAGLSHLDGVTVPSEVRINEIKYKSSFYGYYIASVRTENGETFDALLGFPDGGAVPGDVLSGELSFSAVGKDELGRDGVFLTAEAEELDFIENDGKESFAGKLRRIGLSLSEKFASAYGESPLTRAVLFGDKSGLGEAARRDFSRLGISHLLAISGLHLSVIVALVEFLADKAKLKKLPKCAASALSIVFFMGITGFSVSVVRAGLMHLVRLLAVLIGRKSDPLTSLAVAASVIVIVSPFSVFDTGLLLSVGAAYACIAYSTVSKRGKAKGFIRRILRAVADTVLVTLLVTAVTLPTSAAVFGQISLLAPIVNVFFIPAVTVILYGGILLTLLIPAAGHLPFLAEAVGFCDRALLTAARKVSLLRGITVSLRRPSIAAAAVILALSVIVLPLLKKKYIKFSFITAGVSLLCIASVIGFGTLKDAGSAEVTFYTRGKSDGLVVRDGNKWALADVSDGSTGYLTRLLDTAGDDGAVEIENFIFTHYHRKHVAALSELSDRTVVRNVLLPEPENDADAEICGNLTELCLGKGIDVSFFTRGNAVSVGEASFVIAGGRLSRSTHPVVSFSFDLGGKCFAYAGGSAFEADAGFEEVVGGSDVAFFGAHPPVGKKHFEPTVGWTAVFSEEARAAGTVETEADGGTFTVESGGVFRTGSFKK